LRLVRHPFGIDERFLHEEMSRRQQTHAVCLAAAQNALARQRANNAQKRHYNELLDRELIHLTRRRDGLLQAIDRDMAAAADPSPPCAAQTASTLSIEQLHQRLAQHRALRERILTEVMAVLSPFVTHPARPRYGGK
jgi:hypothetical protein